MVVALRLEIHCSTATPHGYGRLLIVCDAESANNVAVMDKSVKFFGWQVLHGLKHKASCCACRGVLPLALDSKALAAPLC